MGQHLIRHQWVNNLIKDNRCHIVIWRKEEPIEKEPIEKRTNRKKIKNSKQGKIDQVEDRLITNRVKTLSKLVFPLVWTLMTLPGYSLGFIGNSLKV